MGEKNSTKKLVWYVLFALVTVVCCYLFVVVFFYFIYPYNISLKLAFWPFVSEEQVGQMYSEATVKVTFKYQNDEFEDEEISVVGVNIDKDGYILFPFSEIAECTDYSQIKVLTASGTVYSGTFIYGNKDYNLALIKCENAANGKVKIPFVKVFGSDDYSFVDRVVVANSKLITTSVWTGYMEDTGYVHPHVTKNGANEDVLSYTIENGFIIDIKGSLTFNGGAVFDKNARLLGFSYKDTLSIESSVLEQGEYFVMPAYAVRLFYSDAVKAYKNKETYKNTLVSGFNGFDKTEANKMKDLKKDEAGEEKFYFNGDWQAISSDFDHFLTSDIQGYYLFTDFNYTDKNIAKNAIITSISVDGKKTDIEYKTDLFDALFAAKSGSAIKLTYQRFEGTEYNVGTLVFNA